MRPSRLVAAALAASLLAAVPAPRFAPAAGQRYRLTIENRPAAGAGAYVFTGAYDLVFAHEGVAGWTATLTLRETHATAPAAMARMFATAQRPLVDRMMTFHLDAAGAIVALDREEALMRGFADAVAGAGGGAAPDAAVAARLAAPLLAMTPARRRLFLGSPLVTAVASADAGRPAETGRAVTVPGSTPGMVGARLAGTQDVIREATGGVVIRTRAEGTGGDGARTRVTIERRIDPVHGLLVREEKTTQAPAGDDATGAAPRDVTVTTLAPVS